MEVPPAGLKEPYLRHVARHSSPLLYAHVDPNSSVIQAETPVQIGWHALAPALVFTLLATIAVVLRWYSRIHITRTIACEDWLILGALVLSIAMTGVIGGEVHVASKMVGQKWDEAAENVSELAKLVLCSNLLYQILINVTKCSFLLQYLRLFQGRWTQRMCKASLLVLFGVALYGFFGAIFMCSPVSKYWDPRVSGDCMDAGTYWIATAAIGIFMDFAVWILPMPLLRALRLPWRQKLGVVAVFALGGFVCVVSVLRMSLVHMYAAMDDMGRAGIAAIVWSTIESNVGIICASFMVMKPLVMRVFPRLLDSSGSSRRNLRLATIQECGTKPSCWTDDWNWGSRTDAECRPSRITSWVAPPPNSGSILVTKKSVVEANWDSEHGLSKPQKTLSRDSGV